MRLLLPLVFVPLVMCACASKEEDPVQAYKNIVQQEEISDTDSYAGYATGSTPAVLPKEPKLKLPKGIYQVVLPIPQKRLQTIQFFPNHDFVMQEKSSGHEDSIVTVAGTWAPSNGFIWIYKGHVAWGRYKWNGDNLEYYSPVAKKGFAMQKLSSILENNIWKRKLAENVAVFGIGNEPFWSIEQKGNDTLSFLLADKGVPAKMKLVNSFSSGDSVIYEAKSDSAALRMIVLPYFCSDGMSDHTYPNKILVQYNHQTYSGCGVKYQ